MKRWVYLLIVALGSGAMVFLYKKLDYYAFLTSNVAPKLDYIIDSTDRNDLIFIGSSRTYCQVDPRIIDSICKTNSYNIGMDGSTIVEQYMVLQLYVRYHSLPKTVVLSLDESTLEQKDYVYDYPDYFSYARKDSAIDSYLKIHSPAHGYAWLAAWYRMQQLNQLPDSVKIKIFFSSYAHIKTHADSFETTSIGPYYKGFRGHAQAFYNSGQVPFSVGMTADNKLLLQKFIEFCLNRKIKIVLFCPPEYKDVKKIITNYNQLYNCFDSIAIRNGIPLIKYTGSSMCDSTSFFYNDEHLNLKGAAIFSDTLAKDLNHFLQ